MKHLFNKITAAILALFAFVSCSEEVVMDEAMNPNDIIKKISIIGSDFELDNNARSTIQIGESGVKFVWSENDTIGIFPNKGGQVSFAMNAGLGTQTATFSGGGWALKTSATYSAYYPFNFYNRDLKNILVSYEGQTQTGNNNTDHIGAYDFMAASVATPSNSAVAFDMKHLGCLMMLKAKLEKEVTLTKVSVQKVVKDEATSQYANRVFTMLGYMDLTSENPQIKARVFNNGTYNSLVDTLNIELKNFNVTAEETSTIYFMMAPTNLLNETLIITLYDEVGEYYTFAVEGKDFIAGKAYAYELIDKNETTAVDLGLPSGTLWADRNVGAESPEAYGYYFAWGDITPNRNEYTWSSYKWGSAKNKLYKYCLQSKLSSTGQADNREYLLNEDDAASVNIGEKWRMPTDDELQELEDNCTWTWTTEKGVEGRMVTGPNGNSIFLPAAGYCVNSNKVYDGNSSTPCGRYWSNRVNTSSSSYAHCIEFNESKISNTRNWRFMGYSVRAVVR